MTLKALNRALLARQYLLEKTDEPALKVVEQLFGLQAQQARPPFVGLWTRVKGFERADLCQLISRGAVTRATMMRGTLHLMSCRDYARHRATIQSALTVGAASILGDRVSNLDIPEVIATAKRFFAEAPRTFTEVRDHLMTVFPHGDERAMGYTVRTQLPLVVVPDDSEWSYRANGKFALAESVLSEPLATEADYEDLIRRYLAAFGPATSADVQAWSALPGMKPVLEGMRSQLVTFKDERKRELFDLPDAPRPDEDTPVPPRFVADFDNLVLSHADRKRIMADEHRRSVVSANLLVSPTFLIDGFVAGTWKVAKRKKNAALTLSPFDELSDEDKEVLAAEGQSLARFVEPGAVEIAIEFE